MKRVSRLLLTGIVVLIIGYLVYGRRSQIAAKVWHWRHGYSTYVGDYVVPVPDHWLVDTFENDPRMINLIDTRVGGDDPIEDEDDGDALLLPRFDPPTTPACSRPNLWLPLGSPNSNRGLVLPAKNNRNCGALAASIRRNFGNLTKPRTSTTEPGL